MAEPLISPLILRRLVKEVANAITKGSNLPLNTLLTISGSTLFKSNAIPEEAMFFHGFFDHEENKLHGENLYDMTPQYRSHPLYKEGK